MRYELTAIEDHVDGNTQLLLKDQKFILLAVIPWTKGRIVELFLHPKNLTNLPEPVAPIIQVTARDSLPVFTQPELQTVIDTVKYHTQTIQAQNRQTFKYHAGTAKSVASTANLLIQAVVTPGEKTNEGLLIEAVSIPWFEIVDVLKKNPRLAYEINPRKWEEIIAGAYKKAGFDEVTLTPQSGDFGRDVIAVKRGLGTVRIIDQVKAYKPDHLVTANDVRAIIGVLQEDKASKAFLTTTSDFAPRLRDDPLIKPHIPRSLELINGTMLLKRLEELARTH